MFKLISNSKFHAAAYAAITVCVSSHAWCATGTRAEGPALWDSAYASGFASSASVIEFKRALNAADMDDAAVSVENAPEPPAGPFRFKSGFSHSTRYTSNLFNSPIDPEGDLIHIPSVMLGLEAGREGVSRQFISNEYTVGYFDYAEHDKLDRLAHHNLTRLTWRGTRSGIEAENEFRPLSPRATAEFGELEGSGSRAQVIASTNRAALRGWYRLTPKLKWQESWTHGWTSYPAGSGSNSAEQERYSHQKHTVASKLIYDLTAKTAVYGEHRVETADYFEGGGFSFNSHAMRAGFVMRPGLRDTVLFEAGYMLRNMNSPDHEDADQFIYRTAWSRRLSEKWLMSLLVERDLGFDVDLRGDTAGLQSVHRDTTLIGASLEFAISPSMSLELKGGLRFGERDGEIRLSDPETGRVVSGEREDVRTEWGVAWNWRRAAGQRLSAGYQYSERDSNFKAFDHEDHQIMGEVGLSWG
jgi:hypothetical protein